MCSTLSYVMYNHTYTHTYTHTYMYIYTYLEAVLEDAGTIQQTLNYVQVHTGVFRHARRFLEHACTEHIPGII